ncbi:MAG TPA: c-type cytochrome [Candidatus Acidoferrales bacterium]|jgi:cytochrome c553|nr:c-type cytochrome [Candidatus Acidoferrales bacterium]
MKTRMGILLIAVFALVSALAIKAAPPQRGQQDSEEKNMNRGIPWAYGFATPYNPAAVPTPRGAGGAAAAPGAAPAAEPEDRETPRHLPGTNISLAIKDIDNNYAPGDWYPQDHPKMPEIVAHGDKANKVNACGFCHYPNGKGRANNAGPAGLPAEYILQQIEDFKDGARTSWDKRKRNTGQMIDIAKGLTPEEAKAAAEYFASMKWTPYIKVVETDMVPKTRFVGGGGGLCMPLKGDEAGMEPIGDRIVETPISPEDTEPLRNPRSGFYAYVPPGTLKKGEALVLHGGPGKTVACAACHGEGLKGNGNFPSLAGRSPSYLARQLYDFQHFTRVGPGAQMMQPVVAKLSDDDILAIVAYVASLQP